MNRTHFKRATALTLVVTLVLCQGFVTGTPLTQVVSKVKNYVTGASTAKALRLPTTAHLSAHGAVTLNGHNAPTGATVFSGGGVKTAEDSTAVLSFGTMAQVELAHASDFTLAVEGTTLGGQLRAGRATIVAPAGVAVKIVTADGPVVADGREATHLTIDVTAGKTRVETTAAATDATAGATAQDEPATMAELDMLIGSARALRNTLAKEAKAGTPEFGAVTILSLVLNEYSNPGDAASARNSAKVFEGVARLLVNVKDAYIVASEIARAAKAVAQEYDAIEAAKKNNPTPATTPTPSPYGVKDVITTSSAIIGAAAAVATAVNTSGNNTVSPITPGAGS